MPMQPRHEYQRACAYLGSLHDCVASLEKQGVCEPWISALRADMARLARTLQAALNDLERRSETPLVGVTAPQRRPRTAADMWTRQDNLED